jgi:hypothetical protein
MAEHTPQNAKRPTIAYKCVIFVKLPNNRLDPIIAAYCCDCTSPLRIAIPQEVTDPALDIDARKGLRGVGIIYKRSDALIT